MKLPFSTLLASLIIGFALGVYYFQGAPVASRKIASQKDQKVLDAHLTAAFNDCVGENMKDGKVNFSKSEVDGHNWAILSAECLGDKARALYEAVEPYADEQYVKYNDGRRGIGRFFGALYPPSQCVRVTRNSHGNDMNLYSCSIRMDLSHEMVQGMAK